MDLFLFTLLRPYLHRRYKIIAHLLLNQVYLAIKPIKPCAVTRDLKFGDIYYVGNYSCDAINDSIKPAEHKDLLKSCGADDVYYHACGALNDYSKTCGALRFIKACGANDVDYYAYGALNDFDKTCGALRLLKILRS